MNEEKEKLDWEWKTDEGGAGVSHATYYNAKQQCPLIHRTTSLKFIIITIITNVRSKTTSPYLNYCMYVSTTYYNSMYRLYSLTEKIQWIHSTLEVSWLILD